MQASFCSTSSEWAAGGSSRWPLPKSPLRGFVDAAIIPTLAERFVRQLRVTTAPLFELGTTVTTCST